MAVQSFEKYAERCFKGAAPPCTNACPLGLDIRSFTEKLRRGNFTSAFRLYRNQVLFPRIVSTVCSAPCMDACIGSGSGFSIDLPYLERSACTFARETLPVQYNVPEKQGSIAVIGGGLSGLSCALKLAGRRYDVTVYEKNEKPGGRLHKLMDEDIFLKEFETEFKNIKLSLKTGCEIKSLDEINADAVFIASGAEGSDFGLGGDASGLVTSKSGVFIGGGILGASPVQSVDHGIRAAWAIEAYLKVGHNDGEEKAPVKSQILNLTLTPPNADELRTLSREAAAAEAGRCKGCDCSVCIDGCDMMQGFKRNPRQIAAEVMGTMHSIKGMTKRVASRLINSCNQCGYCVSGCPESVDTESCLIEARHQLFDDGALPEAYHDYWMADMEFAQANCASVIHKDSGYLFFPGCQLGAALPECTISAYGYLKDTLGELSVYTGCCGVPADWAGDRSRRDEIHETIRENWKKAGEPVFICACATCIKTLNKYLPEIKTRSLYEVMAENPKTEWRDISESISVFDPCSSRAYGPMQESIRELLSGCEIHQLARSGRNAQCCSFGGQIHRANPRQVQLMKERRSAESRLPYVVYCSNCRDSFASAGKDCAHILELLFNSGSFGCTSVSLSKRRRNRVMLREMLTGESILKGFDDYMSRISLTIPDEVLRKMDAEFILTEDVLNTVEYCLKTQNVLKNPKTGGLIGHYTPGTMTYWAEFREQGKGYVLDNAYTHRMKIQEGDR